MLMGRPYLVVSKQYPSLKYEKKGKKQRHSRRGREKHIHELGTKRSVKILQCMPEKIGILNNLLVLGSSLGIRPVGGDMEGRGGLTVRLLLR